MPPRLRLLDRPHLLSGGGRVDLQPLKPTALLVYLGYRGEWLAREEVASLFWPEVLDSDARHNLRLTISRARQYEWAEGLEVEAQRLRWPVECDARLFREAMARGAWEVACSLHARPLLDGWPALGSPALDEWVQVEREGLRAAWRNAALRQAEALEAAGAHSRGAELLARVLEDDPLAEDVLCALMRATYLAGQRDRALAAFESFRVRLAAELAIEPMEGTLALARTLAAAGVVDVPTGPPARGAVPLPVLRPARTVGRERERSLVLASSEQYVFLGGEPGTGKSRLLDELTPDGPRLRCREGLSGVPYHPLLEALRERPPQAVALGPYLADLARLLPDLYPGVAAENVGEALAKPRVLEALARAVEARGGERFTLSADDLQWADAATTEFLAYLAGRPGARVLGAYRSGEVSSELRGLMGSLDARGLLLKVMLQPLAEDDVRALVRELSGGDAPMFGRWLHERTGGNPLFALETLRSLFEAGVLRADSGPWSTSVDTITRDYSELPIPERVAQVIERRAARLPEVSLRALQAASVLGEDLDAEVVGGVAGLSALAAVDALDGAEEAGLLRGGRFSHDLVRQSLYASLSPKRRRLLHARALEVLAGAAPATRLRHALDGGRLEAVPSLAVEAAEAAERSFAWRDAAALLHEALTALDAGGGEQMTVGRLQVLEALADALEVIGDRQAARDAYTRLERELPRGELVWRARALRKSGYAWRRQGDGDLALVDLNAALAVLGDREAGPQWREEKASILLEVTSAEYVRVDVAGIERALAQARPLVEASGSARQRAVLAKATIEFAYRRDRYRITTQVLATARQALADAIEARDSELISTSRFGLGFASLWAGELDAAEGYLSQYLEFTERVQDRALESRALTYLAIARRYRGDVTTVRELAERALTTAEQGDRLDYLGAAEANLAWVAYREGHPAQVRSRFEAAFRHWDASPGRPYPFEWIARLPLLAVLDTMREETQARANVEALLDTKQMRLPPLVEESLCQALRSDEAWSTALWAVLQAASAAGLL